MGRLMSLRTTMTRTSDERAQGMIEFALIVMVLLLLFAGTVDFSRFLYYQSAISSAARVGAETAMNHCASSATCGLSTAATTDDFVMWSTYCEAAPEIVLNPSFSSCTPCATASCTPTCASSPCNDCAHKDICVSPAGTRTSGKSVTVYVGYSFQPITPIIGQFFQTVSCWPGDSTSVNDHTLCAKSVGQVS
jgi:TadE-like protein